LLAFDDELDSRQHDERQDDELAQKGTRHGFDQSKRDDQKE
jgi:hypothetical protein